MNWATFFKSHAKAIVTGLGLPIGGGSSYALSLKICSACSATIAEWFKAIGNNIIIPQLTSDVQYDQDNFTITLDNTNIVIPKVLLTVGSDLADNLATYLCFYLPLAAGLITTLVLSLEIGSAIATKLLEEKLAAMSKEIAELKLQRATHSTINEEEGDRVPIISTS